MLIFAGHDPGAKNHLRPVYEHAIRQGYDAKFMDLMTDNVDPLVGIGGASGASTGLVCGASINQSELKLINLAKSKEIPTTMIIDLQVKPKLDGIDPDAFPDQFLVTNQLCQEELVALGARRETIVVSGSTYLESLRDMPPVTVPISLSQVYGLPEGANVVSFFTAADNVSASVIIAAVTSLATLIQSSVLEDPVIIVRPHPRMADNHSLESACQKNPIVHYDRGNGVDTASILNVSSISFSMASTVSLESIVLGVPSAFFQVGWDYTDLDEIYKNVDSVPRIRTGEELLQFVKSARVQGRFKTDDNIENCRGALNRTWEAIQQLMAGQV